MVCILHLKQLQHSIFAKFLLLMFCLMSKSHFSQAFILYLIILDVNAEGPYKPSQGTLPQLCFFLLCVTWKQLKAFASSSRESLIKRRRGVKSGMTF